MLENNEHGASEPVLFLLRDPPPRCILNVLKGPTHHYVFCQTLVHYPVHFACIIEATRDILAL